MNIQKLFQGIAIVIDDEIKQEDSSISKIKKLIEEKNIPVVSYSELPHQDVIPSLSTASFIILDWDYFGSANMGSEDERITRPTSLVDEQERNLLSFIEELLKQSFMPVFLFTNKPLAEITTKLHEKELWYQNKPNRIFVQQKNALSSEQQLFSEIEKWLKEVPSVYVLKEWECVVSSTKEAMFRDFFSYTPNWTKIIWEMLKKDSRDNHREFGDFITRQLTNRLAGYSFDEQIIVARSGCNVDELSRIVEGERYISYNDQNKPTKSATGDLYLDIDNGSYYINIRAQCDLARKKNPKVYLIKGNELVGDDIETENICLTNKHILQFGKRISHTLDELMEIAEDEIRLSELNTFLKKQKNEAFFASGNIIGKKSEIIIACVAGKSALKFCLDIDTVEDFSEKKGKLIGRILPPYIICIQQGCANYITREGTMPTPMEVFSLK